MVGLLRVLSILHVSICMPMRWLAGNCGNLSEFEFGVSDMPESLDLMDAAFEEISKDGNLLLDQEFMLTIFQPLLNKITPFQEYMDFMFKGKKVNLVGSQAVEDCVFPFELLSVELWDPTRKDIIQSNPITTVLATEASEEFQTQF